MNYVWATATHQGRIRDRNEDSVYPETSGSGDGPAIVAVADGMGGHIAGNIASSVALAAATEAPADAPVSTEQRVLAGNEAILERITLEPELSGMGTTMTLGRFRPDGTLELSHVGDSRCYLFRNGDLLQLTTDHTVVAELVALGHLKAEDVATHPQRHLVTRTLGLGPVTVENLTLELEEGDRLLFCSDGLTTMVDDTAIGDLLAAGDDPEATAWHLVEAANTAGGVDNITVAIVDVRS